MFFRILLYSLFLSSLVHTSDASETVNLKYISTIESSRNPLAYNARSGARGLYQITPICLADYNRYHAKKYTMDDLYDPAINTKIAEWYIRVRIPQMLRHYRHPVTIRNILIAFNAGISRVGKPLPRETRKYVKRYRALEKQRRRNQ